MAISRSRRAFSPQQPAARAGTARGACVAPPAAPVGPGATSRSARPTRRWVPTRPPSPGQEHHQRQKRTSASAENDGQRLNCVSASGDPCSSRGADDDDRWRLRPLPHRTDAEQCGREQDRGRRGGGQRRPSEGRGGRSGSSASVTSCWRQDGIVGSQLGHPADVATGDEGPAGPATAGAAPRPVLRTQGRLHPAGFARWSPTLAIRDLRAVEVTLGRKRPIVEGSGHARTAAGCMAVPPRS